MPTYGHFEDFEMSKKLQEAVAAARFEKPTELQKQVIPAALEGQDVIFEARSGMGKSACYAIPFLQHWLRARERRALIITADASAVRQIGRVIGRLCPTLKARVMKFTLRDDYFHPDLLEKAPIVVLELGVAERFMKREKEYVQQTHLLGLDEFDTLLAHEDRLQAVVSKLSSDRQTLVAVNELTEQTIERGRWYCDADRLEKVKIARPEAKWSEDEVVLQYLPVDDEHRLDRVKELIGQGEDSVTMILTGSDRVSNHVAECLQADKHNAHVLAYSMQLAAKQTIVDQIGRDQRGIMVGCEAAMNGVNLPEVGHLISWDLPDQIDSYWRRVDRFAYHGRLVATVLVDPARVGAIRILERRLGRRMTNLAESSDDRRDPSGQPSRPTDRAPLIPERLRQPVFAKPEQVEELAPNGLVKTLGSKFVPARKRR